MTESSFRLYIDYERYIVYNSYCKDKIKPYGEEVRQWTDTTSTPHLIRSTPTRAAAPISALKQKDISEQSFSV